MKISEEEMVVEGNLIERKLESCHFCLRGRRDCGKAQEFIV